MGVGQQRTAESAPDEARQQTKIGYLHVPRTGGAQFVITGGRTVLVGDECAELVRLGVSAPQVVRPGQFVRPFPLFADRCVQESIVLPLLDRTLANAETGIRASLRPQRTWREQLQIRGHHWIAHGHFNAAPHSEPLVSPRDPAQPSFRRRRLCRSPDCCRRE